MSEEQQILRKSHIWERADHDWYVESRWVSERLFEEEPFEEQVWDPACGSGNIARSARAFGHKTIASDIVDRGFPFFWRKLDFLAAEIVGEVDNIIVNPPFNLAGEFTLKAISLCRFKVAVIFPVARLNAAHWIKGTPLRRVWLMTPRPSMPPGDVIARGEKPGGGKTDYAWLIWERQFNGYPELRWLRRDKI